jgi:hypothetical protein
MMVEDDTGSKQKQGEIRRVTNENENESIIINHNERKPLIPTAGKLFQLKNFLGFFHKTK